ncbi:hypothetical protein DPMN_100055 [Dreissena polymorpha]|uniref:Uncharacterized protein n=1 Tax=Dreissena polymorpha TaxID=45954 RepID=A0A9D4LGS6_DREPO|nr:hypothetical protein DPMN_100055 [Dreissena polymorpha]
MDDVPLSVTTIEEPDMGTPSKRPRLEFFMSSPENVTKNEHQLYLAEKPDDTTPALQW